MKPLIYAVDDNENDLFLLQRVFNNHFEECRLRLFNNGSDLLIHLTHHLDHRLPDLIFLDLDLPVFTGYELIHILKNNADFRRIPIYILSAMQHKESIRRCHELGSSHYLYKDRGRTQLISLVQQLQAIWNEERQQKRSGIDQHISWSGAQGTSFLPVN